MKYYIIQYYISLNKDKSDISNIPQEIRSKDISIYFASSL